MKKALFTASVQYHFNSFHLPLIELLKKNGCTVDIAARDVLGGDYRAQLDSVAGTVFDVQFERSPFSLQNKTAYRQLKKIISENDYDVIHCNTPVAGILSRFAARSCRKKGTKVIYTAHGFHFYKGASKLNWIIFYAVEKIFGTFFTDCLITICDEDEANARKHKICRNVRRIHGVGVDASKFTSVGDEEKAELREKYGFGADDVICLCTGELNENKNQQMFIKALPEVVSVCPSFRLMLAGMGDNEEHLRALVKELGVEESVVFLGFRNDIDKLIKMSDFICSGSFREGLPVNIIEGMLSAVPAVVSHNRGHDELVEDGVSGFFVPFDDTQKVTQAFMSLCSDKELCKKMGEQAYKRSEKYSVESVEKELLAIYNEFVF